MRRSGDQQVGNAATVGTTHLEDRGNDLTVAAGSGGIEGDGGEGRLDLLQASLPASSFATGRGEMRPGGQFGESDRADGASSGSAVATAGSSQSMTTDVSSRPTDIYRL